MTQLATSTGRAKLAPLMSSSNEHWNTPSDALEPVYNTLGEISLDPCSNGGSIVKARRALRYDLDHTQDGLVLPWTQAPRLPGGRITAFVNPPYGGRATRAWAEKIGAEYLNGVEILALVPARTDTQAFQDYYLQAPAVCLWRGRIKFLVNGQTTDPAPFPSAMVYFGHRVDIFAEAFRDYGTIMVQR